MLIREASFAAIDFESAGVTKGSTDSPVQIGLGLLAHVDSAWQIQPEWSFRSYLQTEQKIVWSAQKVHGISSEDLVGAPTLLSLWPKLNSTLRGRVVVAHGAGTEKRFLRAFPMHGFSPWVDTLKVAHAAFPHERDHSLEALSHLLGVVEETKQLCPEGRFHDALFDSLASLLVLREIIVKTDISCAPLDALIHPERSAYFSRRRWDG
jgi:DNA polymerase-3 subunit epsilon